MLNEDVKRELENTKVLKRYTHNGFNVIVRQENLEDKDRKLADSDMRKQFLEYK